MKESESRAADPLAPSASSKAPEIFISYSWKNKEHADRIFRDLDLVGISVVKDDHVLRYTDKLSDFMQKILKCDYAILLVSDHYLLSKNCMYEAIQLQKETDCWDKVLPIVVSDTRISDPIDRLKYVQHWEEKVKAVESAIQSIDPANAISVLEELRSYRQVAGSVDAFTSQIATRLHLSPEQLYEENYKSLIERIGYEWNPARFVNLLSVAVIPDLQARELGLDRHLKEFGESSYYYTIRAGTAYAQGNLERAVYMYEEAIKLNPEDYTALNNLGRLKETFLQDFSEARRYYEAAIKVKPDFDIPRLNLGVLLSAHFNDRKAAKEQYEAILTFDPNNAKAHNNLATEYKLQNPHSASAKFEYHIKRAIEIDPYYIEARINYANYLKAIVRNKDAGNEQYRLAIEHDKSGNYKDFLQFMLTMSKG
jgi:tetratricopeptide (TPR) repeat protein